MLSLYYVSVIVIYLLELNITVLTTLGIKYNFVQIINRKESRF
jgi:hypothetical protein